MDFESAFNLTFGYSTSEFYSEFESFLELPIEEQLKIISAKYKPISNSCDLTLQFLPLFSGKILVFGASLVKTRQI